MKGRGGRARGTDSEDSMSETSAKVARVGDSPPKARKALSQADKKKKKKIKGDGKGDGKGDVKGSSVDVSLLSGEDDEVEISTEVENRERGLFAPSAKKAAEVTVEKTTVEVEKKGGNLEASGGRECGVGEPSTPSVSKIGEKSVDREGPITVLKNVTSGLMEVILEKGMTNQTCKQLLEISGRYEGIVMGLMLEVERLKGRLDVYEKGGLPYQRGAVGAPGKAAPVAVDPAPKPVETWSVVVRSKDAATTSNQVVSKVVGEVAPALAVRVHDVKPIKRGGAVIRTPSVAERNKIMANQKFKEVGLEVEVNRKKRPRVTVQRVPSEISPDVFMGELYESNLKGVMTLESFKTNVKIVSAPWDVDAEKSVNVVLEGNDVAINTLLGNDRCYIKWFGFRLLKQRELFGCFRCLGLDHGVNECRFKQDVCRRCGEVGHISRVCTNALSCRNCAFKGKPSDHLMVSDACPLYNAHVARMNARH